MAAEGEKTQNIINMEGVTAEQILMINASANLINAVSWLEMMLLKDKKQHVRS